MLKYKALILKYVPCIFYNMPYVFFVSAQHSENLREKFPEKPRTQFTVTCFWEEIRKRRDRGKSNLSQRWN